MLEQFNKEQREEYKKKWNKSGNAGFFNELTEQINSEKVWQWIKQNNKALLKAERARVNGVIGGKEWRSF